MLLDDTRPVLVTGGSGFLGMALARRLREQGLAVRSLARHRSEALNTLGVEECLGDLAAADVVLEAARGCQAVFHVGAKAGYWGRAADYHRANVEGTRNVLAACRRWSIAHLVYTSTPSVVHGGGDLAGVDERQPLPSSYHAHYPATKAIAEREVLAAHGPDLATVALRPHLIWGPGDNHLLPRMVARAKAGRLAFIGQPSPLIDTVYIDNCVDAHIATLASLEPDASCGGRPYFISNGEPWPLDRMVNALLACADVQPVQRYISRPLAYLAGLLCEGAWSVLPLRGEPPMTRFLAAQLSTAHWFQIHAADRDLGWKPLIPIEDGLTRLRDHLHRVDPA